jgi:hypothetical protein
MQVVPSTSVVLAGVSQTWNLERSKCIICSTWRNMTEEQNPANVSCFVREGNNQVPLLKSLLSGK